jgi:uncharacterized membrane protein
VTDEEPARHDETQDVLRCSFCGKDQLQLRKLIQGPSAYICADCVEVCADICADDRGVEGRDGYVPPVIGSVVIARCSLCRSSAPAASLVTVPARGAICDTCLTVVGEVLRERSGPS